MHLRILFMNNARTLFTKTYGKHTNVHSRQKNDMALIAYHRCCRNLTNYQFLNKRKYRFYTPHHKNLAFFFHLSYLFQYLLFIFFSSFIKEARKSRTEGKEFNDLAEISREQVRTRENANSQ